MEVRHHSPSLEIVSAFDRHFSSFIGLNDGFEVTAQSVDKTVRAVSIIERFLKTLRRLAGFQTRGRGIADKNDVRDWSLILVAEPVAGGWHGVRGKWDVNGIDKEEDLLNRRKSVK